VYALVHEDSPEKAFVFLEEAFREDNVNVCATIAITRHRECHTSMYRDKIRINCPTAEGKSYECEIIIKKIYDQLHKESSMIL